MKVSDHASHGGTKVQSPNIEPSSCEHYSGQEANCIPTIIDSETQKKGRQLEEVMRLFKKATTYPLSSCILETPKHKSSSQINAEERDEKAANKPRKSPRLSGKNSKGKLVIRLAQDLVAKKCGII
jgi:hypothetical protein